MRRLIVLMAFSVLACSEVAPPPQPQPPGEASAGEPRRRSEPEEFPHNFTLVFTREYGMWTFRACTLEVGLFVNASRVSLECEPTRGARVKVGQQLAAEEVTRLRELVIAADLYGAEHIGEDRTPNDGIFETLRFRPTGGGQAVVLVTSGNESFVANDARRDLLQFLGTIETALSKNGRLVTR